jgi:hypothetical protein
MQNIPASMFVSDEIHKHPIKLPDGSSHDFNFRELPSIDFRRIIQIEASKDAEERASAWALAISLSIVDDAGERVLTMEQAAKLKPSVSVAMWAVITELNKFSGKAPSSVEAATGSDTSSH